MLDLRASLKYAADWCRLAGVEIPTKTLIMLIKAGIKSEGYFGDVIARLVRQLYNRTIEELEFVQVFDDLLDGQLRDAWLEGMAVNGLTEDDMTPEFELELAGIIQEEHGNVFQFAEDILTQEGQDHLSGENHLDALLSRGELWAGSYAYVVQRAAAYTAGAQDHFMWERGPTNEPCNSCIMLDGVVATAEDWLASGYLDMPNDRFECGRWPGRCQCELRHTTEPVTEGGIPIL